jgi:hypothetical protein
MRITMKIPGVAWLAGRSFVVFVNIHTWVKKTNYCIRSIQSKPLCSTHFVLYVYHVAPIIGGFYFKLHQVDCQIALELYFQRFSSSNEPMVPPCCGIYTATGSLTDRMTYNLGTMLSLLFALLGNILFNLYLSVSGNIVPFNHHQHCSSHHLSALMTLLSDTIMELPPASQINISLESLERQSIQLITLRLFQISCKSCIGSHYTDLCWGRGLIRGVECFLAPCIPPKCHVCQMWTDAILTKVEWSLTIMWNVI